jgi:hypothetical protein
MPTIRNEFSIEQFEEVLQKLAHEQPKFRGVSTEDFTINFSYHEGGSPSRIRVQIHKRLPGKDQYGQPKIEYFSFGIEPKLYMDSQHITKLDVAYAEAKQKVAEFIEKLMTGVKPVPRFRLAQTMSPTCPSHE